MVINEALERKRTAKRRERVLRKQFVTDIDDYREKLMGGSVTQSPEAETMRKLIAKLLERAIANLPEAFRPVFMLREIEGLSVEETAEALEIPKETVKTRLPRSRRGFSASSIPKSAKRLATRSLSPVGAAMR